MKATEQKRLKFSGEDDRSVVFSKHAPQSFRIAIALTADRESAFSVLDVVFKAAIRRDWFRVEDAEAKRWFNHYTVLVTRRFPPQKPRAPFAAEDSPLVEALYLLPRQQLEAFILRHGEEMDLRQIATAMDCSASAAANHLVAGVDKLRTVSGGDPGDFTAKLPAILNRMLPPLDELNVWVGSRTRRAIRQNRKSTILRWVAMILTTGVVITLGWLIWRMIQI